MNVAIEENNSKMFKYVTNEDIKEHNINLPEIPDHPYKTLITEGFGFGKTNALLSLINIEPDIDKKFFIC